MYSILLQSLNMCFISLECYISISCVFLRVHVSACVWVCLCMQVCVYVCVVEVVLFLLVLQSTLHSANMLRYSTSIHLCRDNTLNALFNMFTRVR